MRREKARTLQGCKAARSAPSARLTLGAALLAALLLGAPSARAQQAAEPVAKAKMLFDAGAQAYSRGQYAASIQAFNEAYRLSPRPGIVFSLAQAHRKQYFIAKKPENLREAIRHYREYSSMVGQGGRQADAAEALAELEPLAARLDVSAPTGTQAVTPQETRRETQIMVSSQTPGVRVSLDGGKPQEAPIIQEITPGKHRVKATAPGFITYERDLAIAEGSVLPLDLTLREQPALLKLVIEANADVSVDGRLTATTPLLKPLELSAGRHFIVVTKGGRRPFTQEIDVKRGEVKTITTKLETTTQRIAAYSLLVGGAAMVALGGVAGLVAGGFEGKAEDINGLAEDGNIDDEQLRMYNEAIVGRDQARAVAVSLFGSAVGLGGLGLLLYVFDQPSAVKAPMMSDDKAREPARAPGEPSMELSARPLWGPGFAGASLTGRF